MKKKIIMVLLSTISIIAGAQNAHEHSACETDSIPSIGETVLNEVTITGLTGKQRLKDSPFAFSVVSPQQIHRSIGTNIVDILSHVPGVNQISTGAGISKPVIRGLGYNRVVVVDQGIRQEGQQWGDEHGLEVDALGVHSVELLKGPASLMYGSDAIAGVMILHPEGVPHKGTIQVRTGGEFQSNNGLWNYHAGTNGNINGLLWRWHYSAKGTHCYKNSRDGYVPGTWFRERDVLGLFGVLKDWGHTYLRFSHVDFTPGIAEGERNEDTGALEWEDGAQGSSYARQLPSQRVLHTKIISDNSFNIGQGTLKAIVAYQQNYRREFEESLHEAELAMRLHTINYDLKYQLPLPDNWRLATGLNGMWQKNQNEADEVLIPEYHLIDLGYYITAQKQIKQWLFSGGARADHRHLNTTMLTEDSEEHFPHLSKNYHGLSASLGAVYNVNKQLNLRINIARGFRAPTISELCSNGIHEGSIQYELGNDDLSPELSTQIDLGANYASSRITASASLFSNWITNYIFLSRIPHEVIPGYRTCRYQSGDARLMGGELSVSISPITPLHIDCGFSYVRGIQLHQSGDKRNLPLMPAPQFTTDIRYELSDTRHLRRNFLCLGIDYTMRQSHYYAEGNTETATPDYALFNFSAGTDLHILGHNCINIIFSIHNIMNTTYQSHLSRLKHAAENPITHRQGIYAMGRNFCIKINVPIDILCGNSAQ